MAKAKKDNKQIVKKEPNVGFIVVNAYEPWLGEIINEKKFSDEFYRILLFYVVFSPCKLGSYSRKPLDQYGWINPWHKSSFKKTIDDIPGFSEETFIYINAQKDFKVGWENSGIQDDFYNTTGKEFAVFSYSGETNPHLNMLHHIRNSLAHGRFAVKKYNFEIYLIMEDVTTINGFLIVNARIVLKVSTLLNWLKLFQNGPQEEER